MEILRELPKEQIKALQTPKAINRSRGWQDKLEKIGFSSEEAINLAIVKASVSRNKIGGPEDTPTYQIPRNIDIPLIKNASIFLSNLLEREREDNLFQESVKTMTIVDKDIFGDAVEKFRTGLRKLGVEGEAVDTSVRGLEITLYDGNGEKAQEGLKLAGTIFEAGEIKTKKTM